MKILITNSPLKFFHTTCFYHPDWCALNLAQLAAMVDDGENEIKVLDNWHVYNWRWLFKTNDILPTIKKFKPNVVGISNSTDGDTPFVIEVVQKIRKQFPNLILIGGGQAASTKYEYMLNNGFDFIVMGEGEITFKELISALKRKEINFSEIKGLAYKKDKKIVMTPSRPLVENLDSLPMPARKYLPRFESQFFPGKYSAEIETSRGCPHGCHFCSITAFWNRTQRKKSNEAIMRELRYIKNDLGVDQVYFIDDALGLNVTEYTALFKMMINEKLNIKWFTQIRPDTIANNPEMIKLAKEAGFFGALVGFDAYSEDVLKGVGKRGGLSINQKASQVFRDNGIVIFGVHMFGIPGQTKEELYNTYKYGRKYADIFRMSFFSPIPGTPIFNKYKHEGKIKMVDNRKYPYAFTFMADDREYNKLRRAYFFYWLRHLLSPFTLWQTFSSKDKLMFKMRLQSYGVAFWYILLLILEKTGLRK